MSQKRKVELFELSQMNPILLFCSVLLPHKCQTNNPPNYFLLTSTIMIMIIYSPPSSPPIQPKLTLRFRTISAFASAFRTSISAHPTGTTTLRSSPPSPTSAVSARASVLSTIISSFSPRSMILSADHSSLSPPYRCYRS